jgi:hypothetical protein
MWGASDSSAGGNESDCMMSGTGIISFMIRSKSSRVTCFFWQFCEVGELGGHSQEDLAKFDYKVRSEDIKKSLGFMCYVLVTCWNVDTPLQKFTIIRANMFWPEVRQK